jgi:hypothetical protein
MRKPLSLKKKTGSVRRHLKEMMGRKEDMENDQAISCMTIEQALLNRGKTAETRLDGENQRCTSLWPIPDTSLPRFSISAFAPSNTCFPICVVLLSTVQRSYCPPFKLDVQRQETAS